MPNIKRICIVFPEGNIVNNPSLLFIVNNLLAAGYAIDIFTHALPDNIYLPEQTLALRIFNIPSSFPSLSFVTDYSLVIGIDTGVVFAQILSEMHGVECVFISYEIFFDSEINDYGDIFRKKAAKIACAKVALAIVPDRLRALDLQREYGVAAERMLQFPVSAGNCIDYSPSYFLHEQLNISKNMNIVLFMGSLAGWTMLPEIIAAADAMPENWVLVLHGRYGIDSAILPMVQHKKNIYVSESPAVASDTFSQMLQSARCCIALYNADYASIYTGKNIGHIGLSSGKISTALQHGIPVIVNTGGEIDTIVHEFGCGFVIKNDETSIFSCLSDIGEQFEMSKRCHAAFNSHFNNEKRVYNLLNVFEGLRQQHRKNVSVEHATPLLLESILRGVARKYLITSLKLGLVILVQRSLGRIFRCFGR